MLVVRSIVRDLCRESRGMLGEGGWEVVKMILRLSVSSRLVVVSLIVIQECRNTCTHKIHAFRLGLTDNAAAASGAGATGDPMN